MKVLLVDDEPDILKHGKAFLEREDDRLEVETASSAGKALNQMEEDDYDAVVSNYRMPGMDGLEFLEIIREDRNSDVPFIIFTGKGREEVAIEALNLGANRYLRKGDDPKSQYEALAQAINQEVKRKRTEERFERLFHGLGEPAFLTIDEEIVAVNDVACEKTGYSRGELVGMDIVEDLTAGGEAEEQLSKRKEKLDEGETLRFESTLKKKDGSILQVEVTSSPIQYRGRRANISINRDITEWKKAEEELREAKWNYQELFEKAGDAFLVHDPETGEILDVNERMCEMYGYSPKEIVGKTVEKTSSGEEPYTLEQVEELIQKAKEEGPQKFEWHAEKKSGETFWVEVTLKVAKIGGEPRVLASVRDITERRESEENLKRYRKAVQSSDDSIYLVNKDLRYIFANDEHISRLAEDGKIPRESRDEVVGRNYGDIHLEEELQTLEEKIEKVAGSGEPLSEEYEFLTREKWSSRTYSPIEGPETGEVEAVVVVSKDITERKEAEEREEFLHSLLRHDVRNKTQIIYGYLELLKEADLPDEEGRFVEKALNACEEGADIIEKVRTLRRIEKGEEIRRVSVGSVIKNVIDKNESRASKKGISIEYEDCECKVRGGSS